jgi:hypothetical protein
MFVSNIKEASRAPEASLTCSSCNVVFGNTRGLYAHQRLSIACRTPAEKRKREDADSVLELVEKSGNTGLRKLYPLRSKLIRLTSKLLDEFVEGDAMVSILTQSDEFFPDVVSGTIAELSSISTGLKSALTPYTLEAKEILDHVLDPVERIHLVGLKLLDDVVAMKSMRVDLLRRIDILEILITNKEVNKVQIAIAAIVKDTAKFPIFTPDKGETTPTVDSIFK